MTWTDLSLNLSVLVFVAHISMKICGHVYYTSVNIHQSIVFQSLWCCGTTWWWPPMYRTTHVRMMIIYRSTHVCMIMQRRSPGLDFIFVLAIPNKGGLLTPVQDLRQDVKLPDPVQNSNANKPFDFKPDNYNVGLIWCSMYSLNLSHWKCHPASLVCVPRREYEAHQDVVYLNISGRFMCSEYTGLVYEI